MISSHIRATVNASIEPGQQHSPAVGLTHGPSAPGQIATGSGGAAAQHLASPRAPVRCCRIPAAVGCPSSARSRPTPKRARAAAPRFAHGSPQNRRRRGGGSCFLRFLSCAWSCGRRLYQAEARVPDESRGAGETGPVRTISGAASCAVHVLPRTSSPMDSLVPDSATAQVSITVLSVTQMPRCRRASSSPSRRRDRHRASAERINRKFDDEGLYFRGSNFILRLFGSPRPGRGRPQPCGAWPRRFCLGRQCWRSFSLIGRALFRSNPPASTVCCGPFC